MNRISNHKFLTKLLEICLILISPLSQIKMSKYIKFSKILARINILKYKNKILINLYLNCKIFGKISQINFKTKLARTLISQILFN